MQYPPSRPSVLLPSLALAGAAWLLAPAESARGFSTIGGSLSAEAQRDFRVHDNFIDRTANDNVTPEDSLPGWLGAELALWKAALEWGSGPHGDGTGDPLSGNIGDGLANFDFYWAGGSSGVGGTNDNIASAILSCSAGTLAFVETGISNGWRMRFCETAGSWSDGPGTPSIGNGTVDLQGVGTHEFGHALGLGHSSVSTAVMAPTTINGLSQRNLDPDDKAGVQFVYGAKSSGKPVITSAFVDVGAGTITIVGTNFSTTGNEIRFTNLNLTSSGSDPHLDVTNVNSSNGGTLIVVSTPNNASSGDVMVKQSGTGHATLSNAWPVDLVNGGGVGTDPDATFRASATNGGVPFLVTFIDESTGAGISSWNWDFGDGFSSSLASPTHTYASVGTFDVSLTVVGTNGTDTRLRQDYIMATPGAACVSRLGSGSNPNIYSCANDPLINSTWVASVAGGSVGASGLSLLFAYGAALPTGFSTSFGELLIDPTSGLLLQHSTPLVGGVAAHIISIPNDSSLAGVTIYSQVFLTGVGVLTNGQDLLLGF